MAKRINVLLLFGGRSVEHDISIRSAKNVFNYLDKDHFDVKLAGITKQGEWYFQHEVTADFITDEPVLLALNAKKPYLENEASSEKFYPDVIFPVLHGTDGEDGSIQGMFTALNLPVVGSGVLGSAISMDKLVAKQLLTQTGIPNSRYLSYRFEEKETISYEYVKKTLGMPVILKPVSLGSSVGVAKATDERSFFRAVENTFQYDNLLLIEEFIEGREFEIAVLGNEQAKATVAGEVIVSGDYEFYDFKAKYVDARGAQTRIPADIDGDTMIRVKELVVQAFKLLRCEDYARVDFFINNQGKVYLNEINTIPGFTNISMFPKLWEFEGIDNRTLITRMIELCLQRHQSKNRLVTDYDSDLK